MVRRPRKARWNAGDVVHVKDRPGKWQLWERSATGVHKWWIVAWSQSARDTLPPSVSYLEESCSKFTSIQEGSVRD
jgi:hypothetical protein